MEIQTKFNVSEKTFAIVQNQIIQVRIHQIIINVMKKPTIWYEINWDGDKYDKRHEDDIYKTKEDIIK